MEKIYDKKLKDRSVERGGRSLERRRINDPLLSYLSSAASDIPRSYILPEHVSYTPHRSSRKLIICVSMHKIRYRTIFGHKMAFTSML